MKNLVIPVLDNHSFEKPPIGKIELIEDSVINWDSVNWDEKCFGAGYKTLVIDGKGNLIKSELLEISLIDCPKGLK